MLIAKRRPGKDFIQGSNSTRITAKVMLFKSLIHIINVRRDVKVDKRILSLEGTIVVTKCRKNSRTYKKNISQQGRNIFSRITSF